MLEAAELMDRNDEGNLIAENQIKNRIVDYWTKRSDDFAMLRFEELNGYMANLWRNEFLKYLPNNTQEKMYRILDVGTGSGFFAILLAKQGYHVTGVDLTAAMIEQAKVLAQKENVSQEKIAFTVMDAENLDFADDSFDAVITRNLTWTLPHPIKAYKEWQRVLKKDGILLNFDADYGTQDFSRDDRNLPKNHAHRQVNYDLREECELIKESLAINEQYRPVWDLKVLKDLGYHNIFIDDKIGKKLYKKHDKFYNPAPVFMIKAVK